MAAGSEGYGPVGYGMGGAGVASINDHLAPSWNPANLSDRSGVQGGFYGDLKYETTRSFGEDIDSMIDIMDKYDGDEYGQDEYFGAVLENSDEINRIIEGEDAGLVDGGAGVNASWDNWAFGFNTRVEGTAFWEGDGQSFFKIAVGDNADSQEMARLISSLSDSETPDLSAIDWSDTELSDDYKDAADSIKNDIETALDEEGKGSVCEIFNCSSDDVTSDSIAQEIAYRAEKADSEGTAGEYEVSAENLETFSDNFMGDIIGLANEIQGGGASLSTLADDGTSSEDGRVVAEGLVLNEATFSYAAPEPFFRTGLGDFYYGVNLKMIVGQVGGNSCEFSADDCEFDINDHTEQSADFGVDAGVRYHQPDYGVKVGLVGKNLNKPSFKYPDGDTYLNNNRGEDVEVDPSFRVGMELRPLYILPTDSLGRDWWRLSADYDLTTRQSIFEDYERQNLALGTEVNLLNRSWFNLALRGGMRENLAESEAPTLYTVGTGLQLARANLDLSAVISDRSVEVDGDDVPTVLGANLAFSLQF
ncbi:MAG: conjugal transfer protein TraF [bacterium]